MLKQFNKHCSTYHLLPEYQSAYQEKHSCETAHIKLVNNVLRSMERKKVTALIAIDLPAAFDMVDHDILISLLQSKFGVKGKALDWYKSYLKDRTYKVNVGKEYSTPWKIVVFSPTRLLWWTHPPSGILQHNQRGHSQITPSLFMALQMTMHWIKILTLSNQMKSEAMQLLHPHWLQNKD